MNQYQVNIIWLGLILIALNIIINFSELKSVLGGSATSSSSGSSGSSASQSQQNVIAPGQLNPIITSSQVTPNQVLV